MLEVTEHVVAHREKPIAFRIELAERVGPHGRALENPNVVLGIHADRDSAVGPFDERVVRIGRNVAQVHRVRAPLDAVDVARAAVQAAGVGRFQVMPWPLLDMHRTERTQVGVPERSIVPSVTVGRSSTAWQAAETSFQRFISSLRRLRRVDAEALDNPPCIPRSGQRDAA